MAFLLSEMDEKQRLLHLTALSYCNGDLDDALNLINKGRYVYFHNVTDTTSLGEQVVNYGFLGFIREDIKSYIDFEKIGNDWECNGVTIYPSIKTAIGEISEMDYLKYLKKGLIA